MLCNMLGERLRKSLQLVILRDLPHTYSCTYFYLKGKQRWKQKGLYRFWTLGSLNFIQKKVRSSWSTSIFFVFFWESSYLLAVLCLWSQARPCGFILQLPWWCSSQLHHHLLIYHRSSYKVSAQIQLRPCKDIMISKTKYNHHKRTLTLRWL